MKSGFHLFFCLFAFSAPAFSLDFRTNARLYDHLCEVNAGWRNIEPEGILLEYVLFSSERQRIQKHLELVERFLRARDVSALPPSQQANRLRHLDVLHDYWSEGIFPTNHYHAGRRPYFRDNFGVLCAVGCLLWHDRQHEVVERIRAENNYAYIAELAAQFPEIGTWAQKNGFTTAELAWIQPTYPATKPDYQPWGNGAGLNAGGRINVMKKNGNAESLLFVAGSFSQIGGISANNIAAWDGQNWTTLGSGVTGEIYDMDYSNQKLFVAGDFYLPGDPAKRNIAYWDGNTWTGVQTGDMGGSVLAVNAFFSEIYVGGNFKKINGQPAKFAAKGNKLPSGAYEWVYTDIISVDSTVRSIEQVGDYQLFGGDFTHTSVNSTSGNQLMVNHLAYWYYDDWLSGLPAGVPEVTATFAVDGYLLSGHSLNFGNLTNVLTTGIWLPVYSTEKYGDNLEDGVRGFFAYDDKVYAYGNIQGGNSSYGSGLLAIYPEYHQSEGISIANGVVTAATGFKNDIYLAGNFTELHGDPYPGMARIHLPSVPVAEPDAGIPVEVTAASGRLILRYESLEKATILRLYDIQGRLMDEKTLSPGEMETAIDAAGNWPDGLYVWQLQNASGARSGKWAVSK